MLITCRYCGKVHERSYDCGRRPKRKYNKGYIRRDEREAKFRRSEAWKQKSLEIRRRDNFLCQVCSRRMHVSTEDRTLVYEGLSVHHAVPIYLAWDRRLDDDNLITLCSRHHEMAERGEIGLDEINEIIREQENSVETVPLRVDFT